MFFNKIEDILKAFQNNVYYMYALECNFSPFMNTFYMNCKYLD